MRNSRQQVIDWIINNDELVKDIVRKSNSFIEGIDREFLEEAKDQQLDEVSRNIADHIGANLGLTFEDVQDTIDKATLKKVLEVL